MKTQYFSVNRARRLTHTYTRNISRDFSFATHSLGSFGSCNVTLITSNILRVCLDCHFISQAFKTDVVERMTCVLPMCVLYNVYATAEDTNGMYRTIIWRCMRRMWKRKTKISCIIRCSQNNDAERMRKQKHRLVFGWTMEPYRKQLAHYSQLLIGTTATTNAAWYVRCGMPYSRTYRTHDFITFYHSHEFMSKTILVRSCAIHYYYITQIVRLTCTSWAPLSLVFEASRVAHTHACAQHYFEY